MAGPPFHQRSSTGAMISSNGFGPNSRNLVQTADEVIQPREGRYSLPMNTSKDPHHTVAPTDLNAYSLRWEGHMSDGVGMTFGPTPGAVLSANADEIWLKGNRGDFHIPRNAVVKIGRGWFYPWFFRAVRIKHRIACFPPDLQFRLMASGARDILARLKALGFPTS